MKIAFLHYHLQPGGVTTVLRHQIQVLRADAQLLAISADAPPPDFPCETACVAGIGYSSRGPFQQNAQQIAAQIRQTIKRYFRGACDLLHIHNPLLAKNHLFLDIIQSLQQAGMKLLLQVHDFAEDGRPLVCYRDDMPYPRDCHYVVINTRDLNNLVAAGLSPEGVHLLPNCVVPIEAKKGDAFKESFVLYPVRAIRRKNVGEALLLSRFLPHGQAVFITQPPNSPADISSCRGWKAFVASHGLPVRFEMGKQHAFPSLVASADWVLTTSISEGFGFAFLEPWTAGKALKGRLLPDICQDFLNNNVALPHMYQSIQLPMAWWAGQHLLDRFAECLAFNRRVYGSLWSRSWETNCLQAIQQSSSIDFGMLDETLQMDCLDRINRDPARYREFLDLNPGLMPMLAAAPSPSIITHNRDRIASQYDSDRYRQRLLDIYARVLKGPVEHMIDRKQLLASFLAPERFCLLKWSAYYG